MEPCIVRSYCHFGASLPSGSFTMKILTWKATVVDFLRPLPVLVPVPVQSTNTIYLIVYSPNGHKVLFAKLSFVGYRHAIGNLSVFKYILILYFRITCLHYPNTWYHFEVTGTDHCICYIFNMLRLFSNSHSKSFVVYCNVYN